MIDCCILVWLGFLCGGDWDSCFDVLRRLSS